MEQVDKGLIPLHAMMVQEGNNDDSESYQGPEQLEVQRINEPKGYYKYKDFMILIHHHLTGRKIISKSWIGYRRWSRLS